MVLLFIVTIVTGGLPGHIPGHPWSGPMATMVVSPAGSVHSTPPNTQLLLQSPSPAQRMPHHHVAPMIPQVNLIFNIYVLKETLE